MFDNIDWLWAIILLGGGIVFGAVMVMFTGYFALRIVLRHLCEKDGPLIKSDKPQDIAESTGEYYGE